MSSRPKTSSISSKWKSAKPSQKSPASSKRGPLSAEFVDDESSDEDEVQTEIIQDAMRKTAAEDNNKRPITNGGNGAKLPTSSVQSSSDESSSKIEKEPAGRKKVQAFKSKTTEESSESETESIDESESSSENDSDNTSDSEGSGSSDVEEVTAQTKNGKSLIVRRAPSATNQQSEAQTGKIRPAMPFVPPFGFKAVTELQTSRLCKIIQEASSSGKQIWYITAPASVPLSVLREVDLAKVARGEPVLTHENQEHSFREDTEDASRHVKIMMPQNDNMEIVPSTINEVFQLQQMVRLPTSRQVLRTQTSNGTRPKREQPRGLKMRYRPSGFGDMDPGNLGSSSDETEMPPLPSFRPPPTLDNASPSRKRKERGGGEAEYRREKPKKQKTKHTHSSSPIAESQVIPVDAPGSSPQPLQLSGMASKAWPEKKQKLKREGKGERTEKKEKNKNKRYRDATDANVNEKGSQHRAAMLNGHGDELLRPGDTEEGEKRKKKKKKRKKKAEGDVT